MIDPIINGVVQALLGFTIGTVLQLTYVVSIVHRLYKKNKTQTQTTKSSILISLPAFFGVIAVLMLIAYLSPIEIAWVLFISSIIGGFFAMRIIFSRAKMGRICTKAVSPFDITGNIMAKNMPAVRPLPNQNTGASIFLQLWHWVRGNTRWELMEDWHFELSESSKIIVPKGYVFNGSAIPIFSWLIQGSVFQPLLIHEFGYRYDRLWIKNKNGKILSFMKGAGRAYWDSLLLQISKKMNVSRVDRTILWLAVRLMGGLAWRMKRKLNEALPKPIDFSKMET